MERRNESGPAAGTADRPRGGPAVVPPSPGGYGGPRQEYVEAFDGPAAPVLPDQPVSGPDDTMGGPAPDREAPARPSGRHRAPSPRSAAGGREEASESHWGRTLTGMAAAAVVTVLAVVVTGQVAGERTAADISGAGDGEPSVTGEKDGEVGPAGGSGEAVESGGEPAGAGAEPDYDELMTTGFDLDPGLTATGELAPVGGSDPAADPDAATVLRYRVDVERGVEWAPEIFAEAVHRTLNDERGWGNRGERSFARVSSGPHDFVVTLASPGTTAEWCAKSGLDTSVENVSCDSASTERVMINAWRWAQGAETYGDDIEGYRQMLINHEVGHRLGYGHVLCPEDGALAPVMMQQTKFLTTNGRTCRANPWPHPER